MKTQEFPQTEHILDVWDRQTLDATLGRKSGRDLRIPASGH